MVGLLTEATVSPLGEKSTERTGAESANVCVHFLIRVSHIFTVLSFDPETKIYELPG